MHCLCPVFQGNRVQSFTIMQAIHFPTSDLQHVFLIFFPPLSPVFSSFLQSAPHVTVFGSHSWCFARFFTFSYPGRRGKVKYSEDLVGAECIIDAQLSITLAFVSTERLLILKFTAWLHKGHQNPSYYKNYITSLKF